MPSRQCPIIMVRSNTKGSFLLPGLRTSLQLEQIGTEAETNHPLKLFTAGMDLNWGPKFDWTGYNGLGDGLGYSASALGNAVDLTPTMHAR